MKRLCPVCFTELPEKANYCPVCGKCMRETVEQCTRYMGGPEETIVVEMSDCAILIGGKKVTTEGGERNEKV